MNCHGSPTKWGFSGSQNPALCGNVHVAQVFRVHVFFLPRSHGVVSDLSTRSDDDFKREAILAYLRGESQRIQRWLPSGYVKIAIENGDL